MSVPDDVREVVSNVPEEVIAAAFEEACMSIHVTDDAEGMALYIGDAIAHFCEHSDLGPAREMIYDQSGDAAKAILSALEAAGWVVVPVEPTPEMNRAGANCFGCQGDSADARYEVSVMYRAMLTAAQEQKP